MEATKAGLLAQDSCGESLAGLISPPVTSNRVVGGGAHRLVKSQALTPKHSTRAPCGSQAEQCQQGGDIRQEGH